MQIGTHEAAFELRQAFLESDGVTSDELEGEYRLDCTGRRRAV
jgi:hypothetical protein